jgi:hypothetical protein
MYYWSKIFADSQDSGVVLERLGGMIGVEVGDVEVRRWETKGQRFETLECWKRD